MKIFSANMVVHTYYRIRVLIDSIDISKNALAKKMRLLVLTSLGSQYIGRDLPYYAIASVLQVKEEHVEKWLIDGSYQKCLNPNECTEHFF